jgi:hypothetical protein
MTSACNDEVRTNAVKTIKRQGRHIASENAKNYPKVLLY